MPDAECIAEETIRAITEKTKNLKPIHLIVAGKSGAGKRTLIDSVFRSQLAETGSEEPFSEHLRKISKKGFPLTIFQTCGFQPETGSKDPVLSEMLSLIRGGTMTGKTTLRVSCILYCISAAVGKLDPKEMTWMKNLCKVARSEKIPVILVLTQALTPHDGNLLRRNVLETNPDVAQIVPILAQDSGTDPETAAHSYGLDTLVQVMGELLPDPLLNTLQNVQTASPSEKKQRAKAIMADAVASVSDPKKEPNPVIENDILPPVLISLIASLTAVYGIEISEAVLAPFLSAALLSGLFLQSRKASVSLLFKKDAQENLPEARTFSPTAVGLITAAVGEAYIRILDLITRGELNLEDLCAQKGKEILSSLFSEEEKKTSIFPIRVGIGGEHAGTDH